MFFMPAIARSPSCAGDGVRGLVAPFLQRTVRLDAAPGAASGAGAHRTVTAQRDTVVRGTLHVRDEHRRAL